MACGNVEHLVGEDIWCGVFLLDELDLGTFCFILSWQVILGGEVSIKTNDNQIRKSCVSYSRVVVALIMACIL